MRVLKAKCKYPGKLFADEGKTPRVSAAFTAGDETIYVNEWSIDSPQAHALMKLKAGQERTLIRKSKKYKDKQSTSYHMALGEFRVIYEIASGLKSDMNGHLETMNLTEGHLWGAALAIYQKIG